MGLPGAGAEIVVEGGHLTLKPLTPIPAMRHCFRLYPDDPDDPWVFRVHFPDFGTDHRVVFDRELKEGAAKRMFLDRMSFERRPDLCNPRPWLTGLLAAGWAGLAVRSVRHHRSGERPR
jgi:hypothetical protein